MEKFASQDKTTVRSQQQQHQALSNQTFKPFSVSEENRHYLRVFIQTYHNLPILWDTTLRDYTNREKRAEAYEQLVPIYKYLKRDATLEDVKKKINTLRTNYRKELKVIEAARKQGNVHQPRCWTFYELDFLRNAEKFLAIELKNETSSSASLFNVVGSGDTSQQGNFLDGNSCGYRMNVASTSPLSITEMFHKSFGQQANAGQQQQRLQQTSEQNTSPLGLPGGIQNQCTTPHQSLFPVPTNHQHSVTPSLNPNKRYKSPSANNAIQNSSSTSDEMLNMACDFLASSYPEEESIARTWTHKLKRMARGQRLLAEKFINDIIFEAESGTLHRNSMQVNATGPSLRFRESQLDDGNRLTLESPNLITTTTSDNTNTEEPHNPTIHSQLQDNERSVDPN